MNLLLNIIGIGFVLLCAFALSENKRKINLHTVIWGIALQLILALIILKTSYGKIFFGQVNDVFQYFLNSSDEGSKFLFGEGFTEHFFAFKILPTIIFFSSISFLLFHLGVQQKLIKGIAWVMQKSMRLTGAESLAAAGNIFLGQTESPLLVLPYIKKMSRSEIAVMMTSGMATVAGGVLAAYVGFGINAGHLLCASIMSAPASIVLAKIMFPSLTTLDASTDKIEISLPVKSENIFDALCDGAGEGLKLALNVGAMLIATIAFIYLLNSILSWIFSGLGVEVTIELILSYIFYPFAFLMGIPSEDIAVVSRLIGIKTVFNEFIAYIDLGKIMEDGTLSERSSILATYALCGFSNFSSIAIQIGGIGKCVPERKKDFAQIAFKAMIGATLACLLTTYLVGIFL